MPDLTDNVSFVVPFNKLEIMLNETNTVINFISEGQVIGREVFNHSIERGDTITISGFSGYLAPGKQIDAEEGGEDGNRI